MAKLNGATVNLYACIPVDANTRVRHQNGLVVVTRVFPGCNIETTVMVGPLMVY